MFEATQPPEPLTGEDQASRIEREVTEGVRAKTDATSVTADPATCEEALKRNWLIGDDCPQTKAKIAREEEEQKTFVKSKLRSLNLGEEKTVALTAVAMNFANECDPITHHELGIATAIFMVANRNVFAAAR